MAKKKFIDNPGINEISKYVAEIKGEHFLITRYSGTISDENGTRKGNGASEYSQKITKEEYDQYVKLYDKNDWKPVPTVNKGSAKAFAPAIDFGEKTIPTIKTKELGE